MTDQRAQEQTKLLFTLARIAQLGDEAQQLAIEAMYAFDRYRLASLRAACCRSNVERTCAHGIKSANKFDW